MASPIGEVAIRRIDGRVLISLDTSVIANPQGVAIASRTIWYSVKITDKKFAEAPAIDM